MRELGVSLRRLAERIDYDLGETVRMPWSARRTARRHSVTRVPRSVAWAAATMEAAAAASCTPSPTLLK